MTPKPWRPRRSEERKGGLAEGIRRLCEGPHRLPQGHEPDIKHKSGSKEKAEARKAETDTERDDVMGELEQLASAKADLHNICDYTLKELRAEAGHLRRQYLGIEAGECDFLWGFLRRIHAALNTLETRKRDGDDVEGELDTG